MPWSSNATFLVTICHDGERAQAVYKPGRGERPLWDFPAGLYRREVAAWHLSEELGWGLVPPTILRTGPYGEGSLQLFVPAHFEEHYFTLYEQREDLHSRLRAVCAFDLLANNTDRKSGHVLLGQDGAISPSTKAPASRARQTRTVIWGSPTKPSMPTSSPTSVASRPRCPRCSPSSCTRTRSRRCRTGGPRARPSDVSRDTAGHRYPWRSCDRSRRPRRLVDRGDLGTLLRVVEPSAAAGDWDGLVAVRCVPARPAERPSVVAGGHSRRLCLALDGPGPYAASMLVEDAGHFAVGPLAEVAATRHGPTSPPISMAARAVRCSPTSA